MKSHLFPRPLVSLFSRRSRGRFGLPMAGLVALLLAGSPAATVRAESVQTDDIIGILRVTAPKQLLPKVMEIARQVQPGQQTEALPFILGGLIGDPMLTGVSATENVGVVLVANGEAVVPVLILSLPEESPLRKSLAGYGMILEDRFDWSFAVPAGHSLSLVEGREENLIAAVRAPRRYDLEMAFNAGAMVRILRQGADNFLNAGLSGAMPSEAMLDALAGEAAAVRDFRVGLNLSGTAIEQGYFLKAAPGSPLAGFLDQERPADLDFARFIEADGSMAFLGGMDVAATRGYLDHLNERFGQKETGGLSTAWAAMLEPIIRYLESTNGASGGTLSLEGMMPRMVSVTPSTISDEELVEMLLEGAATAKTFFEEAAQQSMVSSVTPNVLKVGDVAVHLMRTEVQLPEEDAEALAGLGPYSPEPQDVYTAVVNGHIVTASDTARIERLIRTIQKGEPVDNNLLSRISIDEESLFEFQIDLFQYFGEIVSAAMPGMTGVLQDLQEQALEPVSGSVVARGGEGEAKVVFPVETLVRAYQAYTSFMSRQQEPAEPSQP